MAEEKRTKLEMQRKLTMKGIWGGKQDIEEILAAPNKQLDVAVLRGICRRYKPDQSEDGGAYIRFYGDFRGTNCKTGEVFQAPQIIVPGILQDQLFAAMGSEAEVREVQFAVKISVKYDKGAVTQYVYRVESLIAPQDSDPLEVLDKTLSGQKLLPAPPKEVPAKGK